MDSLSSSLSELIRLENLTIDCLEVSDNPADDEKGFVLDCIHLRKPKLSFYMPRLPDVQHLSSHLTTIKLYFCRLEEDPMPILEKLLQLKEVSLGYQSFCGRRMVCLGSGFPQLQKLLFYRLEEWEEWIVEEGSMTILHTLYIGQCFKLKELPDGLRFITSLKELNIVSTGREVEWKEKLCRGGKDYYKVQHIPLVEIDYNKPSMESELN